MKLKRSSVALYDISDQDIKRAYSYHREAQHKAEEGDEDTDAIFPAEVIESDPVGVVNAGD